MRLKKCFLPGAAFLFLLSTANARIWQQTFRTSTNPKVSLPKKDSLPTLASDPKRGFQDLFINSQLSNGISVEQINPLAINFVQDYMDRYGKTMENLKSWGRPYFDMMDGILIQHGLPKELKYLAVIESYLKSSAKSWAGAVGPWQLMPETARNFGLKVSPYYDERTDYFKSTHAACRYLTDLFSVYGDWLLVIAAYNGGPGNVNIAIKKSGSRDFWVMQKFLPLESQNHVKKFIATHYIMEGQGGITTTTKDEARNIILNNSQSQATNPMNHIDTLESATKTISGRFSSLVIIKYISMDISGFNQLNPDFEKNIADYGKYDLKLPSDKMDIFQSKKYDILYESIQLLLHPITTSNP